MNDSLAPCPHCRMPVAMGRDVCEDDERTPRAHYVFFIDCCAVMEEWSKRGWLDNRDPEENEEDAAARAALAKRWNTRSGTRRSDAATPRPDPVTAKIRADKAKEKLRHAYLWRTAFDQLAMALNCLPSRFPLRNQHVVDAAAQAVAASERLTFLARRGAWIVHSHGGEVCTLWHKNAEHVDAPLLGFPQVWFDTPEEAIDAAIAAEKS